MPSALSPVRLNRIAVPAAAADPGRFSWSTLKMFERRGKKYLSITSSNSSFLSALRWLHNNSFSSLIRPFFKLSSASVNGKSIELELPPDYEHFRSLSEHIKDHPNPTDRDYADDKTPLHLDDIFSIAGQLADGLEMAKHANLFFRLSLEGAIARHTQTPGSEFKEWEVYVEDFSQAAPLSEGKDGLRQLDPSNLAPEEIKGRSTSSASESYRLGLWLYTLLTRKNPLSAEADLSRILAEELDMYIGLTEAEMQRPFTAEEIQQLQKRQKLPDNWTGMNEKERILYLGRRLSNGLKNENDLALENRFWNEPKSVRKDVYELLRGLLHPKEEKRIKIEEACDKLHFLETMYTIYIGRALTNIKGRLHAARNYDWAADIELLGAGGMARVVKLNTCAIGLGWREIEGAAKVSPQEEFDAPLAREVRIIQDLEDIPNVIKIIDATFEGNYEGFRSVSGNRPIIVNKQVDKNRAGVLERIHDTLNDEDRIKPLTSIEQLYDTLNIFVRLAETLKQIHARGIIHRDLKLENIGMKDASMNPDKVRIMDFGIAVDTNDAEQRREEEAAMQNGVIKGTPYYLSPEMVVGSEIGSEKSDVFALALCLYQFIYGQPRADIFGRNQRQLMIQTANGKRSKQVIDTLESGRPLRYVEKLLAVPPSLRANDQGDIDLHEVDTLEMPVHALRAGFSDYNLDNGGPSVRLNAVGKEVKRRLVNILQTALAVDVQYRSDMDLFASGLKGLRDYLDREFEIAKRRSAPRAERY